FMSETTEQNATNEVTESNSGEPEGVQGYQYPEGYTARQAAEILSRNSGRAVSPDLVKKLGQSGVIRSIKVHYNLNLYNKEDVNAYKVEERGAKAARAAKDRAKTKE